MDQGSVALERVEEVVESNVQAWIDEHDIPAAAVAVTDTDQLLYSDAFGTRGPDTDDPVTTSTLFAMQSCSKIITAITIGRLADRGQLQLDDTIDTYVPHLESAPGDPITIEELLTHTSGMLADEAALEVMNRAIYDTESGDMTLDGWDDFRSHVASSSDLRVTDEADRFAYYNSGYGILGRVIETVTEKPFEDAVRDEVLTPLGMDRATYSEEVVRSATNRAQLCVPEEMFDESDATDGQYRPVEWPFYQFVKSGGGLFSPVAEFAAVPRLFINGGKVGGEQFLTDGHMSKMMEKKGTFAAFVDGHTVEYGHGLKIESLFGDTIYGHSGSGAFASTWFGWLDEAEIGLVIACTTRPEASATTVGKDILGDLNDAMDEEVLPSRRFETTIEQVIGDYESNQGLAEATVERMGGGLAFRLDTPFQDSPFPLVPTELTSDTLTCTTVEPGGETSVVKFELNDGEVTLLYDVVLLTKVEDG